MSLAFATETMKPIMLSLTLISVQLATFQGMELRYPGSELPQFSGSQRDSSHAGPCEFAIRLEAERGVHEVLKSQTVRISSHDHAL